jgi:hypothetical protein
MKLFLILSFVIFSSLTLSAQCPEYESELQNMESNLAVAIKSLKKTEKAATLEEVQQLIDKAAYQVKISLASATLAKEYAVACDCDEGINSATLIYHAVSDCSTQTHEAAGCGILKEIKSLTKKLITVTENAKYVVIEGTSSCIKIPELEETETDNTENIESE